MLNVRLEQLGYIQRRVLSVTDPDDVCYVGCIAWIPGGKRLRTLGDVYRSVAPLRSTPSQ